jgi:hypothetical protein
MNEFLEKIGEPIAKIADGMTNNFPTNEELERMGEANGDGTVIVDAGVMASGRSRLAGYLTLVMGGLALLVIFLCFTKMGAKVRKKLKLKVSGVARTTKRRVKKRVTAYRKKRAYRRKK